MHLLWPTTVGQCFKHRGQRICFSFKVFILQLFTVKGFVLAVACRWNMLLLYVVTFSIPKTTVVSNQTYKVFSGDESALTRPFWYIYFPSQTAVQRPHMIYYSKKGKTDRSPENISPAFYSLLQKRSVSSQFYLLKWCLAALPFCLNKNALCDITHNCVCEVKDGLCHFLCVHWQF